MRNVGGNVGGRRAHAGHRLMPIDADRGIANAQSVLYYADPCRSGIGFLNRWPGVRVAPGALPRNELAHRGRGSEKKSGEKSGDALPIRRPSWPA